MPNIRNYKTLIFDCDGVILNSNFIKAKCFKETILKFGEEYTKEFMKYNETASGISRKEKYNYFLNEIIKKKDKRILKKNELDILLSEFSKKLKISISDCEVSNYLRNLRELNPQQNWLIVSGSDHNELQEIIKEKGLSDLFNAGIFGSLDSKLNIIKNQFLNKNIEKPVLFLGDSKLDFLTARALNIDFIFISNWTELPNWKSFCDVHKIKNMPNLSYLLKDKF